MYLKIVRKFMANIFPVNFQQNLWKSLCGSRKSQFTAVSTLVYLLTDKTAYRSVPPNFGGSLKFRILIKSY
jgi:hypothetical protein